MVRRAPDCRFYVIPGKLETSDIDWLAVTLDWQVGHRGSPLLPMQIIKGADETVRHTSVPPSRPRSDEHTSELQSLMRISYAVFCLKKKKNEQQPLIHNT